MFKKTLSVMKRVFLRRCRLFYFENARSRIPAAQLRVTTPEGLKLPDFSRIQPWSMAISTTLQYHLSTSTSSKVLASQAGRPVILIPFDLATRARKFARSSSVSGGMWPLTITEVDSARNRAEYQVSSLRASSALKPKRRPTILEVSDLLRASRGLKVPSGWPSTTPSSMRRRMDAFSRSRVASGRILTETGIVISIIRLRM